MAIAFAQKTSLGTLASGTTVSAGTFAANPTVGNYVIAWTWAYSGTTTAAGNVTLSDNIGGNTYTQIGFVQRTQDIANFFWCALFYSRVAATGASFAPKVTTTVSGSGLCICAAEFSGGAASSPADGAAVTASAATGAPAPGSKAFTAGDLVCAVMVDGNTSGTSTVTTPSGFTSVQQETNGVSFPVGEGVYALAPASPTNPTWNSVAFDWAASQFALLPAAGAAFVADLPYVVRQAVQRAAYY